MSETLNVQVVWTCQRQCIFSKFWRLRLALVIVQIETMNSAEIFLLNCNCTVKLSRNFFPLQHWDHELWQFLVCVKERRAITLPSFPAIKRTLQHCRGYSTLKSNCSNRSLFFLAFLPPPPCLSLEKRNWVNFPLADELMVFHYLFVDCLYPPTGSKRFQWAFV